MIMYASITMVLALLPAVTGRGGGDNAVSSTDGEDSGTVGNSNFPVPRFQIANLVAYGLLLLATLVQLASALLAFFHSGSRLGPVAGTVVALTILTVGYALGIALVVTSYSVDGGGFQRFSGLPYVRLQVAASLFFGLADPAIFSAVALVLRDRYRTVQKSSSGALTWFSIAASVLFVTMVKLIAVEEGIISNAFVEMAHGDTLSTNLNDHIDSSTKVFHVYIAFNIVATFFLVASAILVRARTNKDKITSLTLFVVIPLLVLHAIARLTLAILEEGRHDIARLVPPILEGRLPFYDSDTADVEDALDLSTTLTLGVLHLVAMTVLVCLVRLRLWSATPLSNSVQGAPLG